STPIMATPGSVTPITESGTPAALTYALGGDCEFLGFPKVVGGTWQAAFEGGKTYWMPFIKHCNISAGTTEGLKLIFLDGINNEGFSGGPVIWQTGAQQKIIGVISGYYAEPAEVNLLVRSQGSNEIKWQPKEPEEAVNVNSG